MKVFRDMVLPLVIIAMNVVLGAQTGHALFYVMAAVITVLVALRLRHALREPNAKR